MKINLLVLMLLASISSVETHAQWTSSGTTVNNNGNVGVNTPAPLYPLHVKAFSNNGGAATYLWGQGYGTAVAVCLELRICSIWKF